LANDAPDDRALMLLAVLLDVLFAARITSIFG